MGEDLGGRQQITMENHKFTKKRGKRNIGDTNIQKTKDKMAVVSSYISLIMLNVSGLKSPIRRHRLAEQIFLKSKTQIYAACRRHFSSNHTRGLNIKKWKRIF